MFKKQCLSFYESTNTDLFDIALSRINTVNENAPKSKKWIYLLQLFISPHKDKTVDYLTTVLHQQNDQFEYPFASIVAEKLLIKLNEENVNIYNA